MFGLEFFFWPVLVDTIIHPCFKQAVSHVARVCALIIFVFGDFCVFKERFCGNASHPVVAFVSVVAFCGLF